MKKSVRVKSLKSVPVTLLFGSLLTALLVFSSGFAALADRGPSTSQTVPMAPASTNDLIGMGPFVADHPFPWWFQDANNLVLEICLSDVALCLLEGVTTPVEFPNNFPPEAFWFAAEKIMESGVDPNDPLKQGAAQIRMDIEAAFATEVIADGDQVGFDRLRFQIDISVPGDYTLTYPYGVEQYSIAATGRFRAGDDIGCLRAVTNPADPCDTRAEFLPMLRPGSGVGPFLRWDPNVAPPAPAGFIGDPAVEHAVIGSPFNTNFFRVEGPAGAFTGSADLCADPALGADPLGTTDCIESDQFGLIGKILESPPEVTITVPADGAAFDEGTVVTLNGTAIDLQSGDVTPSLVWESSLDGPLAGTGGSLSLPLSLGTHTIMATATDTGTLVLPGGLTGSASITVSIQTKAYLPVIVQNRMMFQ